MSYSKTKIKGKIHFKIIRASNLQQNEMDIPDPYVEISMNQKCNNTLKTETIYNNTNPEWNQYSQLQLCLTMQQYDNLQINAKVMEFNATSEHEFLGQVVFPFDALKKIFQNRLVYYFQEPLPLMDENNENIANGTLELQLMWDGPKLFEGTEQGVFEIFIHNIRNLPYGSQQNDRVPDSYIKVILISNPRDKKEEKFIIKQFQTKVFQNQINPIFDHQEKIDLVRDLEANYCLKISGILRLNFYKYVIKVFDQNDVQDILIGVSNVEINDVFNENNQFCIKQFKTNLVMEGQQLDAILTLSLKWKQQ